MASLVASRYASSKRRESRTPFFSRTYGGYTVGQEQFYRSVIGPVTGKRIVDPMAGQGYSVGRLTWEGANVSLYDINPGPLLLAKLRDPELMRQSKRLSRWLRAIIKRLPSHREGPSYFDGWVAPQTIASLRQYAEKTGLAAAESPFNEAKFWRGSSPLHVAAAIPVLAARELACFRSSDNVTWLRKGGFVRDVSVSDILLDSLDRWEAFASAEKLSIRRKGVLSCEVRDVTAVSRSVRASPDCIVTSPPYANRLDYSVMWGPEVEILASMYGADVHQIKRDQIGTTVVRSNKLTDASLETLPMSIRETLEFIRGDGNQASEIYYYPFFLKYAVALASILRKFTSSLRLGGLLVLFVRDTVRKDTLFPVGQLVREVVLERKDMREVSERLESRVIKSHVGLLRGQKASRGIHGLAQREWWLVFRKEK